mgnify:FL=1
MNEYLYEGPVLQFDEVIDRHYKATTWAISEKKARSNLTYRWKKKMGLPPNTIIRLPGTIKKL